MTTHTPSLQRLYKAFGSGDPKEVKNNTNLLLLALSDNTSQKFLLKKADWVYLLENSNLSLRNNQNYQASDLALNYNSEHELYFDSSQWDILFPSIDPKHICSQGFTPLTALLSTYTTQCHNIGQNHIKYLMGISDFGRGGHQNMTPLDYALVYNNKTDWLSYENWETLYTKCEFDLKKIDINFSLKEANAILFRRETFQIQREQRMLQAQLAKVRTPKPDIALGLGIPQNNPNNNSAIGQFKL